jgi:chromosome segregation ATPase
MGTVIVIVVGLVEGAAAIGVLYMLLKKLNTNSTGGGGGALAALEERHALVTGLRSRFEELYGGMVDLPSVAAKVKELKSAQEALKAERGRITITQAELETIETRLRELEEIERELEASGIETKEELNILNKKQKDLASRNEALKQQITASVEQLDQLMGQVELTTQVQEQVQNMKGELIQTEQKVTDLLVQIEQGNEQYFVLKQRYDALDIEYAQLYEKFSEAEAMMGGDKAKEKE